VELPETVSDTNIVTESAELVLCAVIEPEYVPAAARRLGFTFTVRLVLPPMDVVAIPELGNTCSQLPEDWTVIL
jgi:hypothetical protein